MLRPAAFLERVAARQGEPSTIRTAWADGPMTLVWSPEEVGRIFAAGPELLRAGGAPLLQPFAGPTSILVVEGEEHLRRRRLLLPPFHGERMRALEPVVAQIAARELASWPDGELRALPRMQALTLEVIVHAVFGAGRDAVRDEIRRALDVVGSPARLAAMSLIRRERVWRRFRAAVERVDRLLYREIESGAPDGTILALLLATGAPAREVRDQLVTVLAAGHETTATALAWGMERLAHHPPVMDRLRADPDYADAVVKEILRVRPVLSIAPRTTVAPYRIGDRVLPPGAQVAACLHLAHRRRETWGDPDAFRPERWLEQEPPAHSFVPFGGGVRRCVGAAFATMEMREVLRAVAAAVDLAPAGSAEAARRRSVAIGPARGARVIVRRRVE